MNCLLIGWLFLTVAIPVEGHLIEGIVVRVLWSAFLAVAEKYPFGRLGEWPSGPLPFSCKLKSIPLMRTSHAGGLPAFDGLTLLLRAASLAKADDCPLSKIKRSVRKAPG